MKFRVLSVVLILALVCTMLPANVLAVSSSSVQIGGVDLIDGKYLPSYGTSLTDAPAEDGYAILNGNVLTLCNFYWEGTVYGAGTGVLEDVDAEAQRAAIQISGNVILNLVGNSRVITGSYTAIDSNSDLTVSGSGALQLYGKLNGLIAENFVMESGMLQVKSGLGGNGIAVKDNVTFIGGDLLVDADYGFYSFDYDNYDDPIITVSPAAGNTLTVRYGFRGNETLCSEYHEAGSVSIRSDETMYQHFWFTDGTSEAWPSMFSSPYDLQVAGVYVTEENCGDVLRDGTVRFDPSTCTLTLNQADLRYRGRVIYAAGMDLTIAVLGSSHLVSTGATPIHLDRGELTICGDELAVEGTLYGIFVYGNARFSDVCLTADGQIHSIYLPDGSLELQQAQVTTRSAQNIGINISGDLFIKESSLNNTGAGDGLDANNLVILDSTVTTIGNEDGAWLNGTLRIEHSEVTFVGRQNAVQVKVGTTIIDDSIVNATAKGTGGSMDIAIYAEKGISIERSIVTATSPAGTPAIACINGNGPFEAECSLSIAQVTAPNKSTQIWTFVDNSGNYISNVFLEQRSEILYFGEVEIAETETAFVSVYDSDGKLLYIDVPEVISGRTLLILPEAAAEQMSQAKLFIMDAVTLALSQDAIEPQ